jgi:3-isopropylmalate/(R)-2-methylmalate dehydratase large subunit
MTMTEKILARKAGLETVRPGEFIEIEPDLGLGNDITAPLAIEEFRKAGGKRVKHPERTWLVPDHFTPNKDILSAEQVKILREFAAEQPGVRFFEQGEVGVEHALLPELGAARPGMVIIGADSHTCTYGALNAFATGVGSTDLAGFLLTGLAWLKVPPSIRVIFHGRLGPWITGKDLILHLIGRISVSGAAYRALEFCGSAVEQLSVEGRLSMANMAIEAGAKNGIFPADRKVWEYLAAIDGKKAGGASDGHQAAEADGDAVYERVVELEVTGLEPQVALPHLPENTRPAREAGGAPIHQVVIGSCTNGRIEDLRLAARVLKGKKVAPGVRCLIIPATVRVYRQALEEGLFTVFLDAGAVISPPTCGPCLGGHMGILASGERCVATTNRNFVGRMGHRASEVYLASPATAAASAVAGTIVSPEQVSQ